MVSVRKKKFNQKRFQQTHPTTKIPLKFAHVDTKMIPLVNWLNSYDSINTQFCCQGNPRKENQTDDDYEIHRPYILFTCMNPIDLISVLSMFEYRASTQVYWSDIKSQIEYCSRFRDQEALFETIDLIDKVKHKIRQRMIHLGM
jgi:hypothetical protein